LAYTFAHERKEKREFQEITQQVAILRSPLFFVILVFGD